MCASAAHDWQLAYERADEELLLVPDRSTLWRKRDYCVLALLVGCALRRRKLASLTVKDFQTSIEDETN